MRSRLRAFGRYARIVDCGWLVQTTLAVRTVAESLREQLESDDACFVQDVTGCEWAAVGAGPEMEASLRGHLNR